MPHFHLRQNYDLLGNATLLARLVGGSHTNEVLQWLLKSAQELFAAPRLPCKPQAQFSKKVDLSIGSFTRDEEVISFKKNQLFDEVPSETPLACHVKIGPLNIEYRTGPVGAVLSPTNRNDCLNHALSLSQIPAPTRLRHFFGFRKKFNEWRYKSACPVFYELTDGYLQTYNRLMKHGQKLSMSPGQYFDITEHHLETLDLRKRNAGAAVLLERNWLQISNGAPLPDRFNFSPLAFHEHYQSLYFLPDVLVISVGLQKTYYHYQDVRLSIFGNRFITSQVPHGIQPIDYTWQYVNKNGGPDRRFNDNHQIPIIAVTELDFHFSDGIQIHTAFTDGDAVHNFGSVLVDMGAKT